MSEHILETHPSVDIFCPICQRQRLDNNMRSNNECSRCHTIIKYGILMDLDTYFPTPLIKHRL